MLSMHFLRENAELVKASEEKRGNDSSIVDHVLTADASWREALQAVEGLKRQRNVASEAINQAKKNGEDALTKIKEMRELVSELKEKEAEVENLKEKREELLAKVGNVLHASVPKGKDDTENVQIKEWGEKRTDKVLNHVELCEKLGIADFESSAMTSGHGFYFLKGDLALLNQALIRFAVEVMVSKEYEYIEPPLMLRKEILAAAVDTSEFSQTIYSVEGEDLALIGTSEHAVLGMHGKKTFVEKDLPKKYTAYSMCFRKEVGAHGINEKGLWRTHQFNKVEQFIFCTPEESEKLFQELLENSEEILQALGLPYRVIELCSGDLSLWKQRSYDLEVWRATTQDWGEVMSLSNCTDYQARELDIKVERNGKREVVHTLNNTALATSRIMVAILEHYQEEDGVAIPKVLWPFMQGKTKIMKK